MVRRRRLQGLVAALVLAVLLAVPTVASATPLWRVNGLTAGGPPTQNVVEFGTLTLQSKVFGEFKCKIIAGAPVWNESAKGLNAVEGWEPYLCNSAPINGKGGCVGPSFVTAEQPVELIEELNANSEKVWKAKRGFRTLPWPGELFETTEKTTSLNIRQNQLHIDCPEEGLDVQYEGNLEPKVINGVKNGMSPSKLVFEGEGGKTGFLERNCDIELPCGELYVSGELTMLGTDGASVQLITAK